MPTPLKNKEHLYAGPGRPKRETPKIEKKEHFYNVKVNKDGETHQLSDEEYEEICRTGLDSKGRFKKGNRFGELQKEKRSARERMAKNFRKGEEMDVLRHLLLKSKSETVRLNAARLILEYRHGKPTQSIEQEIFTHENPSEIPEEVQELLDSIGGE